MNRYKNIAYRNLSSHISSEVLGFFYRASCEFYHCRMAFLIIKIKKVPGISWTYKVVLRWAWGLILKSGHAAAMSHFWHEGSTLAVKSSCHSSLFKKHSPSFLQKNEGTDTDLRMERQADHRNLPALSAFLPNWIHAGHLSRSGMWKGRFTG